MIKYVDKLMKNFKKWYILLIFAAVIACLTFSLQYFSLLRQVESYSLDLRFKEFPLDGIADTSIVLVSIDNSSLKFAKENGVQWPWSRDFYAFVTNYLAKENAKAILYDIQFYEPDYDRANISSEESDLSFAEALSGYNKVVLGVQYGLDSLEVPPDIKRFSLPVKGRLKDYRANVVGAQFPIELFRSQVSMLGGINIIPDDDGVIRRVPLFYQLNQLYLPQMSFSVYYNEKQFKHFSYNKHQILLDTQLIQLDQKDNYLINWYGKGGIEGVFRYIPFKSLIQTATALEYGGEPTLSA
nr:CHASE2 domain-containing protein [Candidatus Cloacimonadota bacterium]